MHPIDVCTPKPFQLEHSCVVASQRGCRPVRCLATPHEDIPRSGSLAATVLVPANVSFAAVLARPKTRAHVHQTARGHPMRGRGWGELRFTAGLSLRRPALPPERCDSSSASDLVPIASGIPVASSIPLAWARISSSSRRWSGGRQDRFRGGLVKGVRFTDPGCLPPVAAPCKPPGPKPGRTHGAFCEAAFT